MGEELKIFGTKIKLVFFLLLLTTASLFSLIITRSSLIFSLQLIAGILILIVSILSTEIAIYLLIFSMLLSPEIILAHTPAREVTIRSEDILILIVLFGWIAKTAGFKELGLFRKTPLNRPILIYCLVCMISTLVGIYTGKVNIYSGFFYTLKYIEYFFFYFMVVNHVREMEQAKRFTGALILTCVIVSLYAMLQIPLGERVTAPFEGKEGDPNTLGGYLILLLSITLGLLAHSERRQEKLLLIGLAGLIILPFLYTLSRGSWLAAIPMLIIFIVMSEKKMFFLFILLITAIALPFVAPERVKQRVAITFMEEKGFERTEKIGGVAFEPSASERIITFKVGYKKWQERPILGHGVTGGRLIDSQYIRVLVELGILGIIAFSYLIYSIFKHLLFTYKNSTDPFSKGLSLGLLGGVGAMLGHSLGASTFIIVRIMEPFWFFTGLVMVLPQLIEDREINSKIENQNAK